MTENSKRLSQRAAALSQEMRRIQEDTTRSQDEAKKALDEKLREYIAEAGPGERDSFVEIAERHGVELPADLKTPTSPLPVTLRRPEVPTKPSPEALAASRREPTDPPLAPAPSVPTNLGPPTPPPSSGPRILVIDDDPEHRGALEAVLAEEGYSVRLATNGKEGYFKATQLPRPDLILLDLVMPVMSGIEFLLEFDKTALADVPIVFISGQSSRELRELDPHLTDARVFLGKPLDLERLLGTIRSQVEESRRRRREEAS
jgi:CheY-like chemotaxis protein